MIIKSNIEKNPLSDTDQESTRNQSVKSTDDIPQLEYDECDIQLIADRGKCTRNKRDGIQNDSLVEEIDDDDLDYGKNNTANLAIDWLAY